MSAYPLVRGGVCYLSGMTIVKIGPHKRLISGLSLCITQCSVKSYLNLLPLFLVHVEKSKGP